MKIAICASMKFAKEIIMIQKKLKAAGHKVVIPANSQKYAEGVIRSEDKWEKIEFDVIKKYFEKIKKTDAVLILNFDKDNIKNYVGGNSLIEIAFAHVLKKKIFLFNPIPKISYTDEIKAMNPIVINKNLTKIK